ncbi:hypothetical protein A1E_02645 [Rickettsia canadensis str. McKiel]|uniref:Uncharacterized protein n=1 Tax=Rickettsia canadensis (strain McKiel) TaxID=293613 RepID=A8EYP0_RICCK|nr:hypothetical protein A1E_02645 [Rickettsia canadensis str. McKiel]
MRDNSLQLSEEEYLQYLQVGLAQVTLEDKARYEQKKWLHALQNQILLGGL